MGILGQLSIRKAKYVDILQTNPRKNSKFSQMSTGGQIKCSKYLHQKFNLLDLTLSQWNFKGKF